MPFQGTLTTIIDTDYDDYAVVYSCTNSLLSGVFHSEYIWVLSRSGKISNPTRQNIYEKLDRLSINRSGLTMSDRATCPSNSSTVARESEQNLASQGAIVGGVAAAPAAGSAEQANGLVSSPTANLEKAGVEPTQKSVVVPLLYDLPSPASSASVGQSKPIVAKAPAAPADNKMPQLPVSSSVPSKPVVAASPAKPTVQQPPSAAAASISAQPAQQQIAPRQEPISSAAQPAASSKLSSQQPQQQSLLAKIQQKP